MRIIFPVLFFLLIIRTGVAQTQKADVIVKKDNSKIEAIIKEIDDTVIKYKRFSNPDGPLHSLKKEEVVTILYANGEVEVIGAANKNTSKAEPGVAPAVSAPVARNEFQQRIQSMSTEDLKLEVNKHNPKPAKTGAIVFSIMSGVGLIAGIASEPQFEDGTGIALGAGAFALFGSFAVIQFVKTAKRKTKTSVVNQELIRRGEVVSFKLNPVINVGHGGTGLRIVGTF